MNLYDTCIKAFIKGNLGDDLFIYTLCNRYPNTSFVLCGEKEYKNLFKNLYNLKYISTDSFFCKWLFRFIKLPTKLANTVLKIFHRDEKYSYYNCFDFVSGHSRYNILISGSIFMEIDNKKFSITPYYKNEIKYYMQSPYVIGCNFGPYHSEKYRLFYEECFSKAGQVCFRDTYSYSLFKSIKQAGYAPDILFNVEKNNFKLPKIKNYVLISVLNPEKDNKNSENKLLDKYISSVTVLANELIAKGKNIVFLGFCKFQSDDKIIENIMEGIDSRAHAKSVSYPDISVNKALGYIANSEFVIATRYHAMILGWLFEKPVLPVVYSEKMMHVIEDIAPRIEYVMANEPEKWDIAAITERIVNNKYEICNVSAAVKKAKNHFVQLDKIYND